MKKLLFALCLFVNGLPAIAGHVLGGTITYTHVSAKKYEVYVTIWRDCGGIQLSQSNVNIYSDTGHVDVISSQTKLYQKDISLADTSASCGATTRCKSSGGILGYEEHKWKMSVDFSKYGSNCSFTLCWEQFGRTTAITTGQSNQNFFVMSYINLCYDSAAREIVKFNSPVLAIPYNTDFKYNPDFRDRHGYFDSISYVMSPAMVSRTNQATYGGNFNANRPLTFFGSPNTALGWPAGFRLNPHFGNLEFRPTQVNQVGSVAFKIQGWKKHNDTMRLVGWVQEDYIQTIISTSGVNSPNIFLYREPTSPLKVCANMTGCIDVRVRGDHTSDTLFASWYAEDSMMTVDTLDWNPDSITLRVCFTPDTSLIRERPYIFGIRSWGNACNFIKRASMNYGFVVTSPLDSSKKPLWQTRRSCNQLRIHAYDTTNSGRPLFVRTSSGTYQNDTIDLTLSDTGWFVYYVKQVQNGCDLIFSDSVHIDSLYQFSIKVITPYKTCPNTSLTLRPYGSGGLGFRTYLWQDSSTIDSFTFTVTKDSTFWIKSIDSSGCMDMDTFTVKMNTPILSSTSNVQICTELPGDTVRLQAAVSGGTLPYTYTWIGKGSGNNFQVVPPLTDTSYFLQVRDSIGCVKTDSVFVDRYTPHYPVAINDTTGCFLAAIYLKPTNKMNTGTYQWIGMGSGDSIRYFPPLGTNVKILRYTDSLSCKTYDTVTMTNHAMPNFGLPSDAVVCSGYSLQIDAYLYSGIPPITYKWQPYTTVSDSFVQDIFYQSSRIYLEVMDSTGCSRLDSMDVLVNSIPQISAASPRRLCTGDSMFSLSAISGSAAGIWKGNGVVMIGSGYWWQSRNKNPGIYSVTFEAHDLSGTCMASENLSIILQPSPSVDAGLDTGLCGRGPVTLQASASGGTGAYQYVWNKDTSEKAAMFSTIISTDSIHRVVLTDSNQCGAFDSVFVSYWSIPQAILLLPSADTAVCAGNEITLLGDTLSNGAGHLFEFSYGLNNGTLIPDSSFTLRFKIQSIHNCIDSVSRRIIRNENPEILALKGGTFCEDHGLQVLDSFASPSTGIWLGNDISQDSLSYLFAADSSSIGSNRLHYILIDSSTGCFDLDSVWMQVEEKTKVDFTADSTFAEVSITSQFTDLSTGGLKLGYRWYFGDGDSSISTNPGHFYANPGVYDVSLQIKGNACVSDLMKADFIRVDSASGPGIGLDKRKRDDLNIYPNPSKRSFVLTGAQKNASFKVYDAHGSEIDILFHRLNDEQMEMDFFLKPPSIYFLRIVSEEGTTCLRLILE